MIIARNPLGTVADAERLAPSVDSLLAMYRAGAHRRIRSILEIISRVSRYRWSLSAPDPPEAKSASKSAAMATEALLGALEARDLRSYLLAEQFTSAESGAFVLDLVTEITK